MSAHYHIHLVSDSTGETIESVARACLAQFGDIDVQKHYWKLIRSPRLLQTVFDGLKNNYGLVLYTFVDQDLRMMLEGFCSENKIPFVSVLKPVLRGMMSLFEKEPTHIPGRQHFLDEEYFERIEAIEFALSRDDGQSSEKLNEADVVLVGVSRTSKTPTCIYLAGRGIFAANVPYIPGHKMPDFSKLRKPLIVGLTKDIDNLIAIRRNRLKLLKEKVETSYTDPESVKVELLEARRFLTSLQCPIIDISRKSIEETAAEIIMLLSKRRSGAGEALGI